MPVLKPFKPDSSTVLLTGRNIEWETVSKPPVTALRKFYCGRGKTAGDVSYAQIMRFPDTELELTHDYIQWLFPTATKSQFNPLAPALDPVEICIIKGHKNFRPRYLRAIKKMLKFWRFTFVHGAHGQIEAEGFEDENNLPLWCRQGDHNLLRLTRFMESTYLFGEYKTAGSVFDVLCKLAVQPEGSFITGKNVVYWKNALQQIELDEEVPF